MPDWLPHALFDPVPAITRVKALSSLTLRSNDQNAELFGANALGLTELFVKKSEIWQRQSLLPSSGPPDPN